MIPIIYQDGDFLVCLKPSGILSTDEPGGMPELLKKEPGLADCEIRSVHRLDRIVSGLMVYAKNQQTAAELSKQIADHSFHKQYLAVICGKPKPTEGRWDDLLFRDSSENKTYVVKRMRKGVREAALEYQVLSSADSFSLVKITLLTGRTHQIRAQFSSHGFPLVGDKKYGSAVDSPSIGLWSYSISFHHPKTGKLLSFSVNPPLKFPWDSFPAFCGSDVSVNNLTDIKRDSPTCRYAGSCGGCSGNPQDEAALCAAKQEKLKRLFSDICVVEPLLQSDYPMHYRNKVQAAYGFDKKVISGLYRASSHRIVNIDACLLDDEIADAILLDIRKIMPSVRLTAFDEKKGTGFLRHVLVRRSHTTGEVMVILVAVSPIFQAQKHFLKALLNLHPEITTVILNVNDRFTPVVLGDFSKVIYGKGFIEDELLGLRFRISPGAFYQVNSFMTERLYQTALDYAGLTGKETVLDAYCGTGTIGLCASKKAKQVFGVELNSSAVKDAIANARRNERSNCWFVCQDAGEYMQTFPQDTSVDIAFIDPPRDGCEERFLRSLMKLAPKRIVYVSCNPETLRRDTDILSKSYHLCKVQGVDMFPMTGHVESVALFERQIPQ